MQLGMMRVDFLGVFTVFTILTEVRRLAHAVPAPPSVSVTCDSYGVVVEWMATGLSQQAEFILELRSDFGNNESVKTKHHRVNISDLLLDPAYNRYFVKVKARDGGHESEFAESQIFSYNSKQQASIICNLTFPEVHLTSQDGNLVVNFLNPLHLYRDTPTLRNVLNPGTLKYTLTTNKRSGEFTCSAESETCEAAVPFHDEQKESCVQLVGLIMQTIVEKTKEYCYRHPDPPVFMHILLAVLGLVVFFCLMWSSVFLLKKVDTNMKKKHLSKIPKCLEYEWPPTSLIELLKTQPETVAENPQVEAAALLFPKSESLQESTTLPEPSANSSNHARCPEDESNKSDGKACWDMYKSGEELSGSDLSGVYDRPHALRELSPGDMVETYGN